MVKTSALGSAAPLRCVIVDDDEVSRLLLEHYIRLTPELQLVAAFADSQAALAFLQTSPTTDLLFLDLAMPRLDGWALLSQLPAPTPAVIITSALADLVSAPPPQPVTAYLVKPLRLASFRQVVAGHQQTGEPAGHELELLSNSKPASSPPTVAAVGFRDFLDAQAA